MRTGSFVRKGAAAAADPGTRPGLHGQTLVSSGHADLDRLLGGGLPLGSLLLLLEDGWSGHAASLLRYFLAEGAACGQSLLLAAAPAPAGGLARFIPAQLKAGRPEKEEEEGRGEEETKLRIAWQYRRYLRGGQPGGLPAPVGSTAARAAGRGGAGAGPAGGSRASGGGSSGGSGSSSSGDGSAARRLVGLRDWCHQFDLLKPLGEEGLQQCRTHMVDCSSGSSSSSSSGGGGGNSDSGESSKRSGGPAQPPSSLQQLLGAAAGFVQTLEPPPQQAPQQQPAPAAAAAAARAPAAPLPPRSPQHVGRIAVLSLGGLGWQADEVPQPPGAAAACGAADGAAVLRALLHLKALMRERRCAAVASVPAALFSPADLARMQHIADGVISLEGLPDDADVVRLAPEPASVAGLLHLRKLPALGTLASPPIEVALHLIRNKRRRLAITQVEIDPDAEAAAAEAASGASKNVAAALCGGPPRADRSVDF